VTAATGNRGSQRTVSQSLNRRARRQRLIRLVIYGVIVIVIAFVAVFITTGRTVVPVVSERLFPIRYTDEIAAAAKMYSLDPYLVAAVVKTESGYDPKAVSPAGAVGLMQLMPETADWITGLGDWQGVRHPDLNSPADNIQLGSCYLSYLADMYDGSTLLALAAYNAGPGIVSDWAAAAGGEALFRPEDIQYDETRSFVKKVEHYRGLYSRTHPEAFSEQEE
jgi:soluble lytic murein transglycosylase